MCNRNSLDDEPEADDLETDDDAQITANFRSHCQLRNFGVFVIFIAVLIMHVTTRPMLLFSSMTMVAMSIMSTLAHLPIFIDSNQDAHVSILSILNVTALSSRPLQRKGTPSERSKHPPSRTK